MFVRAAITMAGLALVTACATPREPVASTAPVAVPPAVPSVSPTEVTTDPAAKPVLTKAPATTPPTTTRKPVLTKRPRPVDSNAIIGPTGWQTLHLGMSPAEAEALGVATPTPEGDDLCQVWPAVGASALERVIVHPTHGVFAIHPKEEDWLQTPEGMRIGWTTAQVAATYPDFDPAHATYAHGPTVAVPGNPNAVYRMQFESDVLLRFLLEQDSDICST